MYLCFRYSPSEWTGHTYRFQNPTIIKYLRINEKSLKTRLFSVYYTGVRYGTRTHDLQGHNLTR